MFIVCLFPPAPKKSHASLPSGATIIRRAAARSLHLRWFRPMQRRLQKKTPSIPIAPVKTHRSQKATRFHHPRLILDLVLTKPAKLPVFIAVVVFAPSLSCCGLLGYNRARRPTQEEHTARTRHTGPKNSHEAPTNLAFHTSGNTYFLLCARYIVSVQIHWTKQLTRGKPVCNHTSTKADLLYFLLSLRRWNGFPYKSIRVLTG